jgi:hypothetical protein
MINFLPDLMNLWQVKAMPPNKTREDDKFALLHGMTTRTFRSPRLFSAKAEVENIPGEGQTSGGLKVG